MNDPIELAAIERGAGSPVALVHGGVIHSGPAWAESIKPLAEGGFRVVAVDRRGHGRSQPGDAEIIPVHLQADDLRYTLELRDIARTHLVGVSYGALVCLEFALSWPERVISATLVEPALISLLAGDPDYSEWVERFHEIKREALGGTPLEKWFPEWLSLIDGWLASKTVPGSPSWSMVERHGALVLKEEAGWEYSPPKEKIAALAVPTMIVSGNLSEPPMHAIAEALAGTIPSSAHVWIDGAGHDAHARKPGTFNALLLDFLSKHDAVGEIE